MLGGYSNPAGGRTALLRSFPGLPLGQKNGETDDLDSRSLRAAYAIEFRGEAMRTMLRNRPRLYALRGPSMIGHDQSRCVGGSSCGMRPKATRITSSAYQPACFPLAIASSPVKRAS